MSDRLEARLIHSVKGQDIMPYDDPHWMGDGSMIGSKPVYNAVMSAELLLMVGTDYPYSNFLPNRPVVIQIDERPEVLGRRAPTVFGVLGSARPTLRLLSISRAENGHLLLEQGHGAAPRLGPQAGPAGGSGRSPDRIHPQAVARAVSDLADRNAVFMLEPDSTRCGPATGSVKAVRSASSVVQQCRRRNGTRAGQRVQASTDPAR